MTYWRGVRYRSDSGWELRCESCAAAKGQRYWPLSHEFWDTNKGLSRCRACWVEYERNRRRTVTRNHARAEAIRKYHREWAATKRRLDREAEGRQRYERRKAA